METPAELYHRDLLQQSLTSTSSDVEPYIHHNQCGYSIQYAEHYVDSGVMSMIPLAKLDEIKYCVQSIWRDGDPGNLIDAGVWRDGAVSAALKAYGVTKRDVWVADFFQGLPQTDPELFPLEAKKKGINQ